MAKRISLYEAFKINPERARIIAPLSELLPPDEFRLELDEGSGKVYVVLSGEACKAWLDTHPTWSA